jgi:hypothetical protein
MPITAAQITRLESKGIPVFSFKTRDQCRDMRVAIIRHKNLEKKYMTGEEMHKKYEQMMSPHPPAPAPTNAYIMSTGELTLYAANHGVPIPDPPDKTAMRHSVQAHMDANKSKAGGKKKKQPLKKRTLKKQK